MKTIGILGGMSAASTQLYYRHLCDMTRNMLGGLRSPQLLIRSVDFAQIEHYQKSDNWEAAGKELNREARLLVQGGAQLLLIATNTMHKISEEIMQGIDIPFIHIADATAQAIVRSEFSRPGLMATRFTMEQNFYTQRLVDAELQVLLPEAKDRDTTHSIIYEELCRDIVTPESRTAYEQIARKLIAQGADCLILGCTEVGMLLNADNVDVPVFDTTIIHCETALKAALA